VAAKAVTRKAASRKNGSVTRKGGLWAAAVLVPAIALATGLPFCLLLAAGMLPSAVAAFVDRHSPRYLTGTVAILNLAGTVVPILALLKVGVSIAGALQVLGDGRNWIIMYGAASVGWLLFLVTPSIGRIIVDYRAERDERRLAQRAEQLVAEWGNEISDR
jgi:hypothetical protein